MTTVQEMYGQPAVDDETFYGLVNQSLNPRSSEMLYEAFGAFGLSGDTIILDAGCRDAQHTCRLVERFGVQAIGVDLVDFNVAQAKQVIAEKGLEGQVTAVQANLQDLPLNDRLFDAVWCRDVLSHVPDLRRAVGELGRVLKENGRLLIYQTFATDLLQPAEADWLYDALAIAPASMSAVHLEECLQEARFRIDKVDPIRSEWREQWEEEGNKTTSQQLLRIARMLRNRDTLIAQVGENDYTVELADCHWGVYQMLGKLCPTLYLATKGTEQ
ncbi:MAG: methyltransferase domain-containing protein [Chloroflexota bacterium]